MKNKTNLVDALSGQAPCIRCKVGLMYLDRKFSETHIILRCSNCKVLDEVVFNGEKDKLEILR